MAKGQGFSVVLPTYTGEEYIEKCLASLLNQDLVKSTECQVVVVIDGPNETLRQLVEQIAPAFEAASIPFLVCQLPKQSGRFEARKFGAERAQYAQLLFVDDRVTLRHDCFRALAASPRPVALANIIEAEQPNSLSRLLYLLRKKIYGAKRWGATADSYYITKDNFDRAPKGGAGLWVSKKVFLMACRQVIDANKGSNLAHVSDDTKLLRHILEAEGSIYKSSEAVAYYHPRSSWRQEVTHLYQRGPKFIDYYLKPGTRFRPYLLASLLSPLVVIVLGVLFGWVVLGYTVAALALATILASLYVAETVKDFFTNLVALPELGIIFSCGVAVGLVRRAQL